MKTLNEIRKLLNAKMTVLISYWITLKIQVDNMIPKNDKEELTYSELKEHLEKLSTDIYNLEQARTACKDAQNLLTLITMNGIKIPYSLYMKLKQKAERNGNH